MCSEQTESTTTPVETEHPRFFNALRRARHYVSSIRQDGKMADSEFSWGFYQQIQRSAKREADALDRCLDEINEAWFALVAQMAAGDSGTQAILIAETIATIQTWPKVEGEFEDGKKPACARCQSPDIHQDPEDPRRWACGGCGLNSWSVSVYFPLT